MHDKMDDNFDDPPKTISRNRQQAENSEILIFLYIHDVQNVALILLYLIAIY